MTLRVTLGFIGAIAAFGGSANASATPLSMQDFARLAGRCAPSVPLKLLAGVARTESGFEPWALHDNSTGVTELPASFEKAYNDASGWIGRGDSVDIGLMQINSANLPALSMTASAALDPCTSLAGGSQVLKAAFGGETISSDAQVALLLALSRYNTGSPLKGIMNGYARTVELNIANSWIAGPPEGSGDPAIVSSAIAPDPDAPPSWNVSATGAYAQSHGAPWLISLAASVVSQQKTTDTPLPAQVANNQPSLIAQSTRRLP